MVYNKIQVAFGALRKITGPFISYQYDVQQILVINGLNLPEYYEVDFCNEGDTYTETIVGTANGGVAIPNKFLRTGKKVKAYLVLVGDGDVQTRYEITLPVSARPQRQDIDPTDEQQLQIDALVAALNSGVSKAEEAVKHYPTIIDEYWYVWDGDAGEYVSTDIKAEGTDGTDGVSPTVTVTDITGGHRITITDEDHPTGQSFDVMNGTDGDDGYSPAVTIVTITGGHRITITDKDHPQGQSFDVLDGQGGGGSSDYTELTNKPQINGHTLLGNQTAEQLGLATPSDIPTVPVQSVAGKTGEVVLDSGDIGFDDTETYGSGTVGAELTDLTRQLSDLTVYGTASGDIAKFHALRSGEQIKKVVGTIVPKQSDSGDVRPITGWTGADITSVNNILPNKRRQYSSSIIFLGVDSGTTAEELSIWLDAGTYVLRVNTIGTASIRYGIIGYVSDAILGDTNTDLTFTVPARAQCRFWTTYISTNNIKDFCLSLTAEKTVLSIDWQSIAGTIYGGSVILNEDGSSDVLSTMGNIASYAGETLPGKWISSMDEYEEGVTPTTGAQVVYELDEPLSYHFDNVGKLYTHDAEDWVWISTGVIEEADYPVDTKEYINSFIEEINSAVEEIDTDVGTLSSVSLRIDPIVNFRTGSVSSGTLTDMNTAENNVLYMIQVTDKTSINNLPDAMPADGLMWLGVTYTYTNPRYGGFEQTIQYVFKNDISIVFKRTCERGTWSSWVTAYQKQATARGTVVVDINGHGDFTKFTDGIAYAYAQGDTDVYVKNGIYDITSEIDLETAGAGPVIGKGMRLFFESNAVIQCYYTGSTETVKSTFSPLNAANDKGFEIHNMKIRCKNTRYCVHDEHGNGGIPYVNKYINCDMYLDNSESSWVAPQCIGGGLGNCGIIEIDGGYYEGTVAPGDNYYGEISYHNTSAANSISQIFIKNVYCKNNTVRFGYYGASTMITKCFVNGCSFAVAPRVRPENDSSQIVNMEMIAWGNEIRTT